MSSHQKARLLLQELETTLPKIDRLLTGGKFLPSQETMHFRLAGSDFASHIVGVPLSKLVVAAGDELSVTISALNDNTVDDLSRGRLDLLLHVDDGHVPPNYERQALLREEFVCVVDRNGPYGSKITLE